MQFNKRLGRTLLASGACFALMAGSVACSSPEAKAPVSATSQAAPTASTAPAVTTTPTAKPTPVTLTREQAAQRYLALAKPINDIFDEPKCKQVEDFFVNGGTWPPNDQPTWDERPERILRDCHKRIVPLYEKSIKVFQTTAWPTDALADVADLISMDQAVLHCFKQGAKATTSSAMTKALECFPEDDDSADRVRARFGLPGRTES